MPLSSLICLITFLMHAPMAIIFLEEVIRDGYDSIGVWIYFTHWHWRPWWHSVPTLSALRNIQIRNKKSSFQRNSFILLLLISAQRVETKNSSMTSIQSLEFWKHGQYFARRKLSPLPIRSGSTIVLNPISNPSTRNWESLIRSPHRPAVKSDVTHTIWIIPYQAKDF